jgi:hypothetical protein
VKGFIFLSLGGEMERAKALTAMDGRNAENGVMKATWF